MRILVLGAVLAACGGGGNPVADAADDTPSDARADASADASPDAARGVIRVHAQRRGAPLGDLPVLFHDPAGTLIARAVTDAVGDTSADVPDGSMVTVVFPADVGVSPITFQTVAAAAPGDQLVFGSGPRPPAIVSSATVPTYTGPEPSLVYVVSAPCLGGESITTDVALQASCAPPANGPAVAVVADLQGPGGFFMLAYQDQADVALPPAASLDFTGTWQPAVTQTFAVTNVPAGAEIGLAKTWYLGGQPYFGFGRGFPGVTSGSLPGPGGGDAWRAQTIVFLDPAIQQGQQRFHDLADPLDLGDDFEAHRTAWLDVPTLTLGARATIDWTADLVPDATLMQTRVTLDIDSTPVAKWFVVQPAVAATSGTVTLPELPSDLADLWVGVTPDGRAAIELDRTETLGYAAVRQRWFSTPLGELEVAQRTFSELP